MLAAPGLALAVGAVAPGLARARGLVWAGAALLAVAGRLRSASASARRQGRTGGRLRPRSSACAATARRWSSCPSGRGPRSPTTPPTLHVIRFARGEGAWIAVVATRRRTPLPLRGPSCARRAMRSSASSATATASGCSTGSGRRAPRRSGRRRRRTRDNVQRSRRGCLRARRGATPGGRPAW